MNITEIKRALVTEMIETEEYALFHLLLNGYAGISNLSDNQTIVKFFMGKDLIMPEPTEDDAWNFGNFNARVTDISVEGNLIVEDADSDFWEIEFDRAELA
jgi:hypothetical protein